MYRDCFVRFAAGCVQRITAGDSLSPAEVAAFGAYLDARECAGHSLLGPFAGADASIDTASGRCGVRPPFTDLAPAR